MQVCDGCERSFSLFLSAEQTHATHDIPSLARGETVAMLAPALTLEPKATGMYMLCMYTCLYINVQQLRLFKASRGSLTGMCRVTYVDEGLNIVQAQEKQGLTAPVQHNVCVCHAT